MSKPKVITLTPDILDRNGISTTETLAAARLDFLINGHFATGYDRNGICQSQTPSGANAMTLNGALGVDFRSRRGAYILIYAVGNDTGRTFTVVGEDIDGNRITEAITGPGAGLITLGSTKFYHVTSVTPDAGTADAIEIGVNGYVEFDTPQHVAIYSAGDDSGDTITPRGYDRYGVAITDSITGANAGTSTTQDVNFAWVDRITDDGASAGAVEAGTDGKCESAWFVLNYRGPDFNVGIGCDLSSGASLTYTLQHTFSNVLASTFTDETSAVVNNHDVIASQTAAADGNYTNPPVACRLAITTHSSGSVYARIVQTGRS
jgi:hypothetical protein|tara:strand:+ start:9206 stop:10165 length:960 start_codon:yes stop_codon:yes gene_type:complete